MKTNDPAVAPLPALSPLRESGRRGRPYRPEVVEVVRALLGTPLRFAEIAARTGVGEATIGRWSRHFRFAAGEGGATYPVIPGLAGGENPEPTTGLRRAETRDAARAMVEGTRLGLERIGLELGIGTATLSRWVRRGGWHRPAPPDKAGPSHYRSRTRRGRPYMADAVETARDLVTGTLLSQKRIAAQAGVSQATVSIWIRKRGWIRPAPRRGSRRFAAAARTAPLATTGNRRGRPYAPEIVAEARRLFVQTELPTIIIAARLRVTPVTVARWARLGGWTRPRDIPNPDGSPARRRRRSRRKQVSRRSPKPRIG